MEEDMGASASQTGLVGLRPEPSSTASLGHSATIPSGWRAGSFLLTGPRNMKMAGWIYGYFALDRRCAEGWNVNHLPTGFSAGRIIGDLDTAMRFVEVISERAEWNFTDPEEAPKRAMVVRDVQQELGVTRESGVGSPQGRAHGPAS